MPWLAGWKKRIKLDIDYTNKIGASVTWFPVTIHLKDANGDSTKVFLEVGANSRKIAITKADGETELKGEIDEWNYDAGTPANSTAIIHASIDGWTIDEDTSIYLYYDNDHADNANIGTVPGSSPASDVWDGNFRGVWHLKEAGVLKDSTPFTNPSISDNVIHEVVAKIGKGIESDAVNERVTVDGEAVSLKITGHITVEGWLRSEPEMQPYLASKNYSAEYEFSLRIKASGYQWRFYRNSLVGQITHQSPIETWFHAVAVDNGINTLFYEDGDLVGTTSRRDGVASDDDLNFGNRPGIEVGAEAKYDEIRISASARSAAWIKGTYNAGNDSLLTYGEEETSITQKSVSDAGSGVEIVGVKSKVGISDSGQGAETPGIKEQISLAESGVGSDIIAAITGKIPVTDQGSGVDIAAIKQFREILESGTGSETLKIKLVKAITDSGAGQDLILAIKAKLTLQESGSGADVISILSKILIQDSGLGQDIAQMLEMVNISDSGIGNDIIKTILAKLLIQDLGLGADTLKVVGIEFIQDSGVGADLASILAKILIQELGVGSERVKVPPFYIGKFTPQGDAYTDKFPEQEDGYTNKYPKQKTKYQNKFL